MRVINSGTDVDTIVSATWSHNPDGIFTWDSVSLPTTIGSHDTDNLDVLLPCAGRYE